MFPLLGANQSLNVARHCDGRSAAEVLAKALMIRGMARSYSGDIDGLEDLRQGTEMEMSEAAGNVGEAALAYSNLADAVWLVEGPLKGLVFSERAQELGLSHGYVYTARWAQMGKLPSSLTSGSGMSS